MEHLLGSLISPCKPFTCTPSRMHFEFQYSDKLFATPFTTMSVKKDDQTNDDQKGMTKMPHVAYKYTSLLFPA